MNNVTSYAINALWIVTFFLAVGWVLSRFVRRAGPWVEHKLWVAILILATVVPATPIVRGYFERETARSEISPAEAPLAVPSAEHARSSIVVPSNAVSWVSGIYLATILFFLLRLTWMIRRTVLLVRNATPVSLEGEYAQLWEKSTETFLVNNVSLRSSPEVSGPVAAGFRRPVLLLPTSFLENHSPAEFLAAVGHECAHIQRSDFRKNVFYEAASIFIAFHPLAWLIKSQLAQTREMICDGMTAYQLLNRRTYAQLLVQLAGKMRFTSASPAVGMFDTNTLERRIMTLTTQPKSRWGNVSAFGAVLVLFGSVAASWSLAQTVATQSSSVQDALLQRLGRQDLTCTYYGENEKNSITGKPGTCWLDENEAEAYRCYLNEHPEESDTQTACEWKVQRALKAGK